MLLELYIKNFVIIDEIRVSFAKGLNVISGETGAGKSIIIGALGLLLGDRALSDMIRSNKESMTVEGVFDISAFPQLKEQLREIGCDNDDELIIRRIVSRVGKNRIYTNGTAASLATLLEISPLLVSICSQREHQLLLTAENHINILDKFAGILNLRQEYFVAFTEMRAAETKLNRLKQTNAKRAQEEDFLKYQLQEIEAANLAAGEDTALAEEKAVIANVQKLRELSEEALSLLYLEQGSATEKLKHSLGNINEIAKIDSRFNALPKALEESFYQIEDAAFSLRDYLKTLEFSSERLAEIDERLELIKELKRKYGTTIDDILSQQDEFAARLKDSVSLEEEMSHLAENITLKEKTVKGMANALSIKRKDAAKRLKKTVETEIHSLKLDGAVFEVVFKEAADKLDANGKDAVEFYLSTNAGEKIKPLNNVASGGELSRIVLAIKSALANLDAIGTIVFDEVDSGIGGAVASLVGEKISKVAHHHQVICITHLPQIACFADTHFAVSKSSALEHTATNLTLLTSEESIDEITSMLSGKETTIITREHAKELIAVARK